MTRTEIVGFSYAALGSISVALFFIWRRRKSDLRVLGFFVEFAVSETPWFILALLLWPLFFIAIFALWWSKKVAISSEPQRDENYAERIVPADAEARLTTTLGEKTP